MNPLQQIEQQTLDEGREQSPPTTKTGRDETTMIIMMDGWMARHRGPQWGMKPPEKRADRVHWHEIKSAVIFRLNQRVQTSTGRRICPVLK